MQDIQAQSDTRQVAVHRVGIKDLQLPIRVLQKDQHTQTTIATLALSVELSHNERGAHMSRFVEELDEWRERAWSPLSVELLLDDVRRPALVGHFSGKLWLLLPALGAAAGRGMHLGLHHYLHGGGDGNVLS